MDKFSKEKPTPSIKSPELIAQSRQKLSREIECRVRLPAGGTWAAVLVGLVLALGCGKNLSGQSRKPPHRPWVNYLTQERSPLLDTLLRKGLPQWRFLLEQPERYRLQLVWTQVRRDKYNRPYVRHHTWRLDSTEYFFPASTVKLPTAAVALEKLHVQGRRLLSPHCPIEFAASACTPAEILVEGAPGGRPSLAWYILNSLTVSDNPAYNRLYEFVGPEELHTRLWSKGYTSARIVARYGVRCPGGGNLQANAYRIACNDTLELQEAERVWNQRPSLPTTNNTVYGQRYYTANYLSLRDLHLLTMAVMAPTSVPDSMRFYLRKSDFRLLHRAMGQFPDESDTPRFDPEEWRSGQLKYLYYGGADSVRRNLRSFNKVGMGRGFLTDSAYLVDFQDSVETFISVSLYTEPPNASATAPQGYEALGQQFMRDLGRLLLDFERRQQVHYKPRLGFYWQFGPPPQPPAADTAGTAETAN